MSNSSSDIHALRVDQVGSLLRPESLKAAFRDFDRGAINSEELRERQDEAVQAVIHRQETIGMPVVTDGEFRRWQFQDSFSVAVSGFATRFAPGGLQVMAAPAAGTAMAPVAGTRTPDPMSERIPVAERLRLARNLPLEEYQFSRNLTDAVVKVTLLGPARVMHRFDPEGSRQVYSSVDEFMVDVVAIQRRMVRELVDAGCRYIQIDAPAYTVYTDATWLRRMREWGDDPDESLERAIAADNAVIDGFPDVTFGIHICRGNNRSMWHREGTYDAIAERVLGGLRHQRLLLEYDSERAGSFDALKFIPRGTTAVLGLISTKFPELESVDALARRIEQASRYIDLSQLAISPQCGFASGIAGNLISEDDQWRKLAVMLETARTVWG